MTGTFWLFSRRLRSVETVRRAKVPGETLVVPQINSMSLRTGAKAVRRRLVVTDHRCRGQGREHVQGEANLTRQRCSSIGQISMPWLKMEEN